MDAGIGDYILATKYSDGDPQDHFCVGFLSRIDGDLYIVVDGDGVVVRPNGFRRVEKITKDEGDKLVAMFPEIADCPGPSLWAHLYRMRYGSTNIMERHQMITDEQVRRAVEYTGSKKNSGLRVVIDDSIWLAECMITEGRLIIEARSRNMPGYGYRALVDRHPKAEVLDEDADSESLSTMIVGAIMMARYKLAAAEELKKDGKDDWWDLPGKIYVCNEIGCIKHHPNRMKVVKWLDGRIEHVSFEMMPPEMVDLSVGTWFEAEVHRGLDGCLKRIASVTPRQPPTRRSPEERREALKKLKSPPPVEDDLLLDHKKMDHNQRMKEIAKLAVESMGEPENDEELERWVRKLGNQWSGISEEGE